MQSQFQGIGGTQLQDLSMISDFAGEDLSQSLYGGSFNSPYGNSGTNGTSSYAGGSYPSGSRCILV